jgi:hypothetical protein
MDIDMVAMTMYGRKMAKHFFGCEPRECIKQLNEALDMSGLSALDYNFLLGVRQEMEVRFRYILDKG